MDFLQSQEETKKNFMKWWRREDMGRPLVKITSRDKDIIWPKEPDNTRDIHIDAEYRYAVMSAIFQDMTFYGEAMAVIDMNIGPGSMAVYLGSEPEFRRDTIWYSETVKNGDISSLGTLSYNENAYWWVEHKREMMELKKLIGSQPYKMCIPDIIENLDILAALCSPQELCYLMVDEPDLVKQYVNQIDNIYFNYYDEMYDIVKDQNGGCNFTAFDIWSEGRTAKVQCDFSALLSPSMFEEFVIPSLDKQIKQLDYSLYHLDGPDCIVHLDALMQLEGLNALQWTAGAGKPDGGDELWYPIYDKVRKAGKGLWISMDQGGIEGYIEKARNIVARYGSAGIYFLFPTMSDEEAKRLFDASLNNFR